MKHLLKTYLVTLMVVMAHEPQTNPQTPVLRAGVSVQMPATRSAVAMPDADALDAVVLAVTAKGDVYLGVTRVAPADLTQKVKAALGVAGGKKLYIKVDARTSYVTVSRVLDAARQAGVVAPNLLTAQLVTPQPSYPVTPAGLEVTTGPAPPSASQSIAVQSSAADKTPELTIDNAPITPDTLEAALAKRLQQRNLKLVLLKADGRITFGAVVQLIDSSRLAGARVFLATTGS
jgi:biopolymer transport protein ExbD